MESPKSCRNTQISQGFLYMTNVILGFPTSAPGGSAVIVGSYIPTDPATDGIMIGYYQTKKNFHVFSEYKKTGVEVTFMITVTNFLFSIATKDKRVLLNDDLVSDGWYSLIVQNISIKNMEIHTGSKPHVYVAPKADCLKGAKDVC
ncbi:hypothetical protein MRX96_059814 [Rhipicephalus microplus]